MWRWADEQGEQRLVAADELRTAIVSGVLPPTTLVWREGMTAWVPANSVPEFSGSGSSGEESRAAEKPPAAPTNPPAVSPVRSTLQGMQARELQAAVKTELKDAAKDKRSPSVGPPRPATGSVKPPTVKTLRPNYGPAIPAAPRLPAEAAAVKPAPAPRPVVAPRAPAVAAPVKVATPAPPPRAPSTTAIDKDWSITDDETTNVPGKTAAPARPEPPPEAAPVVSNVQQDAPSPGAPQSPAQQPSRGSVVRTAPPPSPHAEHRPTEETTESTTFQFAKNTLSLRAVKLPAASRKADEEAQVDEQKRAPAAADATGAHSPPGLMESYGKQPGQPYRAGADDPPPTAPSADLGLVSDDGVPAYANTTVRIDSLPQPPKMREPTMTAMLPMEFHDGAQQEDAIEKALHEVSQTVRMDTAFLSKVRPPSRDLNNTSRIEPDDTEVLQAQLQLKEHLAAPSSPGTAQNGLPLGQLMGLPQGAPQVANPGHSFAPAGSSSGPIPLKALLMSGAMLITMVIGAFFVGRCSVKPSTSNAPTARAGFGTATRAIQASLPGPPKPCWVLKQPARWAPVVSRDVTFELLTLASGKISVGYAKSNDEAVGIQVTPATGQVDEDYVDKAKSEIARVTPLIKGFYPSTIEAPGSLKALVPVPVEKSFYLGYADKHVAWAEQESGAANRIWPLADAENYGNIHTFVVDTRGIMIALRAGSSKQRKVFAGLLGLDRKPIGNLATVVGSGGISGEPMLGSNGREVAIVFGDQAGEQSAWKMRLGHAAVGKVPAATTVVETPAGGPGGDANYPAIGGLADGRWVLVWTEGSSSTKSVRAQTLSPTFTPVGDPIVLSPPAGNYGSSMVGVVGNYVTVVFVLKGKSNNELWGSVLQCG